MEQPVLVTVSFQMNHVEFTFVTDLNVLVPQNIGDLTLTSQEGSAPPCWRMGP